MELIGYVAALLMGFTLGLMGGGGSILTVPILVYFFHMNGVEATTGSLFVVGATALVGTAMNHRNRSVDWKTGFLFALPSMAGVFFSRKIILPVIPDHLQITTAMSLSKASLLLILFSLLMVFSARAMLQPSEAKKQDPQTSPHLLNVTLKGFLVGTITGFVGAGGGFLIVPALTLLLQIPIRLAIGTSLAIISLNSIFGFAISFDQHTNWTLLLIVTSLGVVGLFAGIKLSPHIPEKRLKSVFAYFILAIGVFVFSETLWRSL